MRFNQWQNYNGEIQYGEMTISYTVSWVRDVPRDTVQIDEILEVKVLDSNCEEIVGYYNENRDSIDDLIIEDASKHEPDEWEQPSWSQWQIAMAEEKM